MSLGPTIIMTGTVIALNIFMAWYTKAELMDCEDRREACFFFGLLWFMIATLDAGLLAGLTEGCR